MITHVGTPSLIDGLNDTEENRVLELIKKFTSKDSAVKNFMVQAHLATFDLEDEKIKKETEDIKAKCEEIKNECKRFASSLEDFKYRSGQIHVLHKVAFCRKFKYILNYIIILRNISKLPNNF